mgnify:CR=1 FL=1
MIASWIVIWTIAPIRPRSPSIKWVLLINSINLTPNQKIIANRKLIFPIFREKLFKKREIWILFKKRVTKKAWLFRSTKSQRRWPSLCPRKLEINLRTKDPEKSSLMIIIPRMKRALMLIHLNLSKKPTKCHLSSQQTQVFITIEESWQRLKARERGWEAIKVLQTHQWWEGPSIKHSLKVI